MIWLWAPNEWCLIFGHHNFSPVLGPLCTWEIWWRLRIINKCWCCCRCQAVRDCWNVVAGGQGTGAHHFLSRKHGWGSWASPNVLSACRRPKMPSMMIQIILIFIDEFIDILNRTEGANRGNTMAIMIDLDCPAFLQGKPIIVDGREVKDDRSVSASIHQMSQIIFLSVTKASVS